MKTQCERNKSAWLYLPFHQHALDAAAGNESQVGGTSGLHWSRRNLSGDAGAGTGFTVFYRLIRRKNTLPLEFSMGAESRLVVVEPDTMLQLVPMPTPDALVCACNVQPM